METAVRVVPYLLSWSILAALMILGMERVPSAIGIAGAHVVHATAPRVHEQLRNRRRILRRKERSFLR